MHLQKIEKLKNGNQLFIFFSNDKGRGKNNCTIQLVESTEKRKLVAKMTKKVLAEVYTTSWNGDINFSKAVQSKLGIDVNDIKSYAKIKISDAKIKNQNEVAMSLGFEKLKLSINKKNPNVVGVVTKEQLIKYVEQIYYKGWFDRQIFDLKEKIYGVSTKTRK